MTLPLAADVAERLRGRLGSATPVLAVVLGSGLGGLAARIAGARRVSYAEIDGFARTAIEGHAGELIAGELADRPVLALAGRFHTYEGHSIAQSALPVRVVHALGARHLLLSNAAGGIRRTFGTGELMVINDHINLMWSNPLTGPVVAGDTRFPEMSAPYDRAFISLLHDCARQRGITLHDGVYCALQGPSYETPAEVRMLERLGADAVGMSTVPEVLVARALGMRVAGISCITNPAAGLSAETITHADVVAATGQAAAQFEQLVVDFISRL